MARTGLRMMPTFPSSPLRFRTAGFPRYGSKAGLSDGAFPCGLRPSFAAGVAGIVLALSRGCTALLRCRHASGMTALPQRPSLRSGLCCPGPSSLNRPHPSHWPTPYNFPALRVIGPAFAVLACCQPRHSTTGFRAFAARSFSACRPLLPRRVSPWRAPSPPATSFAFAYLSPRLGTLIVPLQSASCGSVFRGFLVRSFATTY